MDVDATLRQAIAAAKQGRGEEARHLLEAVLDADERNEQAWLWLSGLVDSDEERAICLENVLAINPGNAAARQGLAALGAGRPAEADRRVFIAITIALILILVCIVAGILAYVAFSSLT